MSAQNKGSLFLPRIYPHQFPGTPLRSGFQPLKPVLLAEQNSSRRISLMPLLIALRMPSWSTAVAINMPGAARGERIL